MKKLLLLILVIGFMSCEEEPVETGQWFDVDLNIPPTAMQAVIVNNNSGITVYEGLYVDWLKDRLYVDGETYIVVLESYDHQIYYGKFIKTFHD